MTEIAATVNYPGNGLCAQHVIVWTKPFKGLIGIIITSALSTFFWTSPSPSSPSSCPFCFWKLILLIWDPFPQNRNRTSLWFDGFAQFLIHWVQFWKNKFCSETFTFYTFWSRIQISTKTGQTTTEFHENSIQFLRYFVAERRRRLMTRESWVFVPIFYCQLLWKFSTMSICAFPLSGFPNSGFVDFYSEDLWGDLLATAAGWCHTQPLLYRWISMNICHEYLLTCKHVVFELLYQIFRTFNQ